MGFHVFCLLKIIEEGTENSAREDRACGNGLVEYDSGEELTAFQQLGVWRPFATSVLSNAIYDPENKAPK